MQHIKLDRKCLWSTGDLHLSPPPFRSQNPPLSVISAFSVFPAMFSSVYSFVSLGWERERVKRGERRSSVAVNSSHLSPGLSFNCSALPAGSSLLWLRATLFFTAFYEYHFPKQLLWGFSGRRSNLITYPYVNVRVFLALAGHNIFHMQGFQVSNTFDIQNTLKYIFFLVECCWKNAFWGFDSHWSESIDSFCN